MSENNSTIAAFAEKFDLFKAENRGLLADLETAIEEHLNEVADVLDDYAADLKSSLGADVANEAGDDEDDQESAIDEAQGECNATLYWLVTMDVQ